jgi:superfamily II DNA or RNA helicase
MASNPNPAIRGERDAEARNAISTSKILDGNWYYVPVREADMPAIRKGLTIEIEDHFNNQIFIPLYELTPTHVKVPRLFGLHHYGKPRLQRLSEGEDCDPAHFNNVKFTLQQAQQLCIEALRTHFFTKEQIELGSAGCVLNLACGKGKTHIGIQRVLDVKKRTLVVCHSNVSVSQWIKHFGRSLPDVTTSEFHGNGSFPQTDVVIATIHPLALERSTAHYDQATFAKWLNSFGQIIYDEIHIFGAPKFSSFFNSVHSKIQLGLSATPERSDGMELNFSLKVGPVLDAQANLGIKPPTFGVTVYPITPPLPTTITPSAERRNGSYATSVKAFTLSDSRADYLVETLHAHFKRMPNDNILVFCNYIEEVNFLFQKFIAAFQGYYVDRVCEDVCAEAIATMADTARILICTYKKGGTAFSPVRFRAVVIWSPTRAMVTQAVGRIQRWRDEEGVELGPEGSWNSLPRTIYDFIDTHTVASSQYYSGSLENGHTIPSRRSVYIKAGYKVFKPKESKAIVSLEAETETMFKDLGFN